MADHFKTLCVVSAAAHTIERHSDDRMVIAGQRVPVQVDRSRIAGISSDREADLIVGGTAELSKAGQVADDHIGTGNRACFRAHAGSGGKHAFRCLAVDDGGRLDGAHRNVNVQLADDLAGVRSTSES